MSGTWIKRKSDEHQCKKPGWDAGVSVGDIWQCLGCGKCWAITKIEFEDRPAGAIWISWAENAPEIGSTR